jgi:hypothetical protein
VSNISSAVIAQKIIQLGQRRGHILVATSINNLQTFIGVSVIKTEPVFAGRLAGEVSAASRQRRDERQ